MDKNLHNDRFEKIVVKIFVRCEGKKNDEYRTQMGWIWPVSRASGSTTKIWRLCFCLLQEDESYFLKGESRSQNLPEQFCNPDSES